MVCDTRDEFASSINPFFNKRIANQMLRRKKFRPWARYRNNMPDSRQCYICILASRRACRSKGGPKYLPTIKSDNKIKARFKDAVATFMKKTIEA